MHLIGAAIVGAVSFALFLFGMAAFMMAIFVLGLFTFLSTPKEKRQNWYGIFAGVEGPKGD
jgi:hypothetical protein